MKKFFSNMMKFFKRETPEAQQPKTGAQEELRSKVKAFQQSLESLDVDAVIRYVDDGGDINIKLERLEWYSVDGDSYSRTIPVRALDLVKDKSEALTKLLTAVGAKTQAQIAAEEEAKREAEELRLQALEKEKKEREAEEEVKREAERLAKVEAYLS